MEKSFRNLYCGTCGAAVCSKPTRASCSEPQDENSVYLRSVLASLALSIGTALPFLEEPDFFQLAATGVRGFFWREFSLKNQPVVGPEVPRFLWSDRYPGRSIDPAEFARVLSGITLDRSSSSTLERQFGWFAALLNLAACERKLVLAAVALSDDDGPRVNYDMLVYLKVMNPDNREWLLSRIFDEPEEAVRECLRRVPQHSVMEHVLPVPRNWSEQGLEIKPLPKLRQLLAQECGSPSELRDRLEQPWLA